MLSCMDKYFVLKKFLGVEYFEDMVNTVGEEGLSRLNDQLEAVLQIIEKDPEREIKQGRLKDKLKSEFYDTLPEMEWAAHFSNKNLLVVIEPCFPNKGPDLKVVVKNRWIYFEITVRGLSEEKQELNLYSMELSSRIEKIKSGFSIIVDFNESFSKEDLIPLIKTIKKRIADFKEKGILKPVTTYYFSPADSKDWYGFDGINDPEDLYTNPEKYPLSDIIHTAKAEIIFYPRDNLDYTSVSCGGPARIGFGDIDKINSKLHKKQNRQLLKNEPNVIILHDAGIRYTEDALYGKLQETTLKSNKTGEIIDTYLNRDNSGLFRSSTRVSAVVFVGYDRDHEFKKKVFLNPNAKNPLCEEEIKIIRGV
ncbi:MAG: hypothetical protein DIAAKJNI_00182 [Candidatus Argoarchaeum ethanivorans]|uniref:Uncharacterized protein n=1 Tax=Candidatus Argoarchaeum ethanivorans TaxID=2608793 RepID=A0A811T7Z7_9EURY|nr:MAG: hypothetical protein DIAAKJNI_00182 [Candidatus Argoarchaeum ethanivorans]